MGRRAIFGMLEPYIIHTSNEQPHARRMERHAWLRALECIAGAALPADRRADPSGHRRDGHLNAGDRLTPQRSLAASLRADLTTITRVYDEARRAIFSKAAARPEPS
jgi:hypothetical protein